MYMKIAKQNNKIYGETMHGYAHITALHTCDIRSGYFFVPCLPNTRNKATNACMARHLKEISPAVFAKHGRYSGMNLHYIWVGYRFIMIKAANLEQSLLVKEPSTSLLFQLDPTY